MRAWFVRLRLCVLPLALSACVSGPAPHPHAARHPPGGAPLPTHVAHGQAKLSDDYTLTGRQGATDDTNFFLESPSDEATTELPDFIFTPRAADIGDEVAEQMFPTAPGSVEDALGEVRGPTVQVFTVVAEGASVRSAPTEEAATLRPLAKGERVVGFSEGAFARIGGGEFVPIDALSATPRPDADARASLPWSEMGR